MSDTNKKQVLVICGDGVNCENETAWAFEKAGATATILHINTLLETPKKLLEFDILALPGGFSFGDELGSGRLLSLKIKHGLMEEFKQFVDEKRPIIGICNGFQVLVKLGILPDKDNVRVTTLAHNQSGRFIDKWVDLKVPANSVCKWLNPSELSEFPLPIRHGEGRIVFKKGEEDKIYSSLKEKGQIALQYTQDVNGSHELIAGLTDESGYIFGLMPHPEASLFKITNPKLSDDPHAKAFGIKIFENILTHL